MLAEKVAILTGLHMLFILVEVSGVKDLLPTFAKVPPSSIIRLQLMFKKDELRGHSIKSVSLSLWG